MDPPPAPPAAFVGEVRGGAGRKGVCGEMEMDEAGEAPVPFPMAGVCRWPLPLEVISLGAGFELDIW